MTPIDLTAFAAALSNPTAGAALSQALTAAGVNVHPTARAVLENAPIGTLPPHVTAQAAKLSAALKPAAIKSVVLLTGATAAHALDIPQPTERRHGGGAGRYTTNVAPQG